ncbi:NfeD family protein [Luteolibacter flavescens]|uniref:NfeD family protein n=1 Tax=Luteolibacter flavescens TaxID=1859460 RepID=A0ABT3FMB6_9BACT|nr:NfeD family protein [Luteolibacter flavescens]MCW1884716.1 NfeD family protein [Luteolibacter flavescens]
MPIDPEIVWLIAGVLLILAEFFAPGVVMVFFGAGAIATSVTTWLGLTPGLGSQAATFAITSLLLLFTLRRFVKKWFVGHSANGGGMADDDFTGREARVIAHLPGRGEDGLIEIKGSNWKARSEAPVATGETVIIERREGLTFHVRPRF